ncbi:MAG: STAS domain-containing protein, partial [Desulfobacterales bacterium]
MKNSKRPSPPPYEILRSGSGDIRIDLRGNLDVTTAPVIRSELISTVQETGGGSVVANLADVSHLDDFGALLLSELRQQVESEGRSFSLDRAPETVEQILSLVHFDDESICRPLPRKERTNAMVRLGRTALRHAFNSRYMVSFLGSTVLSILSVIVRPRSLRW